jgi:hypothetical protein
MSGTYVPTPTMGDCFVDGVRMFHYLKHEMPRDAKGRLTDVEVYNLIAFMLATKKLIGSNAIIDRKTLPLVVLQNNTGLIPAGCPTEAGGFAFDKFAPKPIGAPEFIPAPPIFARAAPARARAKPKPAPNPPVASR